MESVDVIQSIMVITRSGILKPDLVGIAANVFETPELLYDARFNMSLIHK